MKTQNSEERPPVTEPPPVLSEVSRELFTTMAEARKLWGIPHELEMLKQCLLQRDRAEACRLRIEAEGEVIKDRFDQPKPHPLLIAERQSRLAFQRMECHLPWHSGWPR